MINGIMKLFYTEVVKSKISKLPNEQYEINSKFKKVQEISAKIDTILLYTLKILVAVAILLFSYKINIYFGIGMCLVEISYLFYKKSLKTKVEFEIENIKNNITYIRDILFFIYSPLLIQQTYFHQKVSYNDLIDFEHLYLT